MSIKALMDTPEVIQSPQTQSTYTVIAIKDGARLAINCRLFQGTVSRDVEGNVLPPAFRAVGLTLRIIEVMPQTGAEEPFFKTFDFRAKDEYKYKDGTPSLRLFRGEKYDLPLLGIPCSGDEFTDALKNEAFPALIGWLKEQVKAAEGVMVVSDTTLEVILGQKFEGIPVLKPKLFKLPTVINPGSLKKAKPPKKHAPDPEDDINPDDPDGDFDDDDES